MPIGNQEIWDNGIGAGATNVIFGQPAQTNYNPGALGADPNAQAASPEAQQQNAQPGGLETGKQYYLVNGQYLTEEEYQNHLSAGGQPATVSGVGNSNEMGQETRDLISQYKQMGKIR